uniref:Ankyrin repeat protein n=1 Tax=viral metagenome TaxID=1070528 RepID=A0A6C0D0Z3_9ZZZZ
MAPMSFFERVKRSLKNPNIKQFKKLAALKEGRSLIATAVSLDCTADLLRLFIKENCGDIDGECDFTKPKICNRIPYNCNRIPYNALSIAVVLHRSDLVEILLHAGAKYKTKNKSIFEFAIKQGYHYGTEQELLKMLKTFLHHDPLVIKSEGPYSMTPFWTAIWYGDGYVTPKFKYTIVKFLIENGADTLKPSITKETYSQYLQRKLKSAGVPEDRKSMYNDIFSLIMTEYSSLYFLHKGRMLYDAHFINEHVYEHDRTSIDHLPTPIKNRIDNLPRVLYPTEGLSAVPGGKVEITDSKTLATQEILHQVWSMKNSDVFRDLLEYI